ncbi:MAG: glycosyltransferase family 4 protein [Candidatus Buchananbacteria bacterium]|jgi:glycosyltransferase involved in cell wall biosynthesis
MKIAIYQPRASYYVGGGEVVPLQHAKFLSLAGHQVTLVTVRAKYIKSSGYFLKFLKENPQVKVAYIDLPEEFEWIYGELPGQRWIRWDYESLHVGRLAYCYFLRQHFDLIAVHNYLDSIAVPFGQKSVLHLHGYPLQSNYMHDLCATIPSAFISVSELIKQKWLDMAPIRTISVAVNGIDADHFIPMKTDIEYDALYVGRLIETKGINYLIEALAKLRNKAIRVAIAGSGPEEGNLRKLAKEKKLTQNVHFLGYVKDEDLPSLYNSALMVVLPSYDREGILTTMLEAGACGRPVITTTACSMSEYLKNGGNGLLVAPRNAIALAEAMNRLLADSVLADSLGRNARIAAAGKWSWQIRIKQVEKIYEKTFSKN